ncbi:MAG: ribosome biogenesis GTPase YlqF [Erysipelotrichaceae bacterium]|nr:ribosome biogenesis GTPase YlqF [Erysipelotrichaceae bacterium]
MSEKNVTINWFPGHMAKARRQMEEQLKSVDIVIELRDARIPDASANPMIGELVKNKPVLVILNKADLSDPVQNQLWKERFTHCLICESTGKSIEKEVVGKVKEILKDKLEKAKARGIKKKVLRAMVAGIPNVGKSTFINNIVKKKAAKAENRPGVTKSLQWIRINEDVELLDTPGVLWPKFEDQNDARLLALLGSIKDEILDKEDLVLFGLEYLKKVYPGAIEKRYQVKEDSEDLIDEIGRSKQLLEPNGTVNRLRCMEMILKDIRGSKIGRISWQHAGE